jgi:hypothetical protein
MIALTTIEAKIPTAGISNTNKNVEYYETPYILVIEFPPITKAAQVA